MYTKTYYKKLAQKRLLFDLVVIVLQIVLISERPNKMKVLMMQHRLNYPMMTSAVNISLSVSSTFLS